MKIAQKISATIVCRFCRAEILNDHLNDYFRENRSRVSAQLPTSSHQFSNRTRHTFAHTNYPIRRHYSANISSLLTLSLSF